MERLRDQARKNLEANETGVRRWWVDKYKLPANHTLFQTRSFPEWQIEMYEDLYMRRDEVKAQMENAEVDPKKALKVLSAIETILGEGGSTQDPLVDEWEEELASGRIPDLE